MTIFDAYVDGILNGTSSNDLVIVLSALNARIATGDGNDTILVGSAVNSIIDGGGGNDRINVLVSSNSVLIGGTGNDYMVEVFGSSKMYGDAPDTLSPVPLFLFFDTHNFSTPQIVTFTPGPTGFGNDVMFGGMGDDLMCGDSGSLTNAIYFYTAQTAVGQTQRMLFDLTSSTAVFGNDTMYGGAGNDRMNGDADTTAGFTLAPGSTPGATAIANGSASVAEADFLSQHNAFIFGHDKLFGGDGNDTINGDVSVDAFEVAFGVATATNGGHALSVLGTVDDLILYGNDQISGGNGNDIIAGDGLIDIHRAVGGAAYADGAGSDAKVLDWVGFIRSDIPGFDGNLLVGRESHVPLIETQGNDVINGDAGNDTIYGDSKIYYNVSTGGTATALNGGTALSVYIIDGTVLTFGKDQISGGTGDDNLVGDTLSTELEVNAGTATGAGATVIVGMINFIQKMGDDNISGGDGKDLIIGDVLDYKLLDSTPSVSTVSGHIKVADHFNNNITFGNDILSGGCGSDNFITTVALSTDNKLVAQGFDKIVDFSVADDMLTFVGTNMTTLAAHTQLVHSGCDTILNFDGGAGGSITLQNVNVSSLSALHITLLADSSSIVSHFPG